MAFKPLNGNVLLEPIRNQAVFKDADSVRDLQFAIVRAICDGSVLEIEQKIVYNPRNVTTVQYKGNVYNVIHENNIIGLV